MDKLQDMLSNGLITQEAFDALASAEEANDTADTTKQAPPAMTEEQIQKLVQSAVDKATNKLGNENKNLRTQLESIKKEHMTEEERRQAEIAEKEQALLARETELRAQENRLHAIKALKKAGLDDGSEASLQLAEFVLAEDENAINERVIAFKKLLDKMVQNEVDKTFKTGSKPSKSGAAAPVDNPYSKHSFNLTKQMELEEQNPELAKQFQMLATQ